jgi:hypothetical protein
MVLRSSDVIRYRMVQYKDSKCKSECRSIYWSSPYEGRIVVLLRQRWRWLELFSLSEMYEKDWGSRVLLHYTIIKYAKRRRRYDKLSDISDLEIWILEFLGITDDQHIPRTPHTRGGSVIYTKAITSHIWDQTLRRIHDIIFTMTSAKKRDNISRVYLPTGCYTSI